MKHKILDPCSGSRMMWFDKNDQRTLFGDIRYEEHTLKDRNYSRHLEIHPDIKLDFRDLPFPDNSFKIIVFDPPHLIRAGKNHGWPLNTASLPKAGKMTLNKDLLNASEYWKSAEY